MLKSRLRITSCFLWVVLTLMGFYSPSPASAETYTATEQNRDFYFVTQEPMTLTIRTYAQQYGIDSMLWIYDGEQVLTANDDYYGLDSYVSFDMVPGVNYRLRAGVCCGDPNRWYGTSYIIEPSLVPTNAPIVETTTTTEATTTTTSITTTTTTTEPPTTTTSSTTTTSTTTSTTTTSTTQPSTTTSLVATTTLPVLVVEPSSTSTSLVPAVTSIAPTTTQSPATTTTTSTSTSTSTTLPVISSTTTIPAVTENLSTKDAILIVTSVAVVQSLSSDEAVKVFDAVEVSELTNEQATQLIEAVQDAPEEVRAAFEQEVNVFDNKFNEYVPLGSNISVGQRKVLIAATGVLFIAPTVSVSSSTSGSSSTDSRRKQQ